MVTWRIVYTTTWTNCLKSKELLLKWRSASLRLVSVVLNTCACFSFGFGSVCGKKIHLCTIFQKEIGIKFCAFLIQFSQCMFHCLSSRGYLSAGISLLSSLLVFFHQCLSSSPPHPSIPTSPLLDGPFICVFYSCQLVHPSIRLSISRSLSVFLSLTPSLSICMPVSQGIHFLLSLSQSTPLPILKYFSSSKHDLYICIVHRCSTAAKISTWRSKLTRFAFKVNFVAQSVLLDCQSTQPNGSCRQLGHILSHRFLFPLSCQQYGIFVQCLLCWLCSL